MRILGSLAFGVIAGVLGYHYMPSAFWDHGPYLLHSDRLEGAFVVGAWATVLCFVLNPGAEDSRRGLFGMAAWILVMAYVILRLLRHWR